MKAKIEALCIVHKHKTFPYVLEPYSIWTYQMHIMLKKSAKMYFEDSISK